MLLHVDTYLTHVHIYIYIYIYWKSASFWDCLADSFTFADGENGADFDPLKLAIPTMAMVI